MFFSILTDLYSTTETIAELKDLDSTGETFTDWTPEIEMSDTSADRKRQNFHGIFCLLSFIISCFMSFSYILAKSLKRFYFKKDCSNEATITCPVCNSSA